MSHRSRASRVRHHIHCDSCYSRRCRARVEVSVSCVLTSCPLLCGAVFHICKEEDHMLLCPNVRVPCLNAAFGCTLQMPRSSQAAHLQVCPASVVCCSMEWNRWPANDAHSHPNTELHANLIRDQESGECLDLAMALKDQERLFYSMKIKTLFPELIQSVEEEEIEGKMKEERKKEKEKKRQEKEAMEKAAAKEARDNTWESFNVFNINFSVEKDPEEEEETEIVDQSELTQEEREALASATDVDADLLVNYNAWERMFSMEMGGCRVAEGSTAAGKAQTARNCLDALPEEDEDTCAGAAAGSARIAPFTSTSSCLLKKSQKNFVYGHVEPMKIITVRTFKIPTSFAARQGRIRNTRYYRKHSKAVDTSDLGVALEDMPVWEEVQASLLCSLEKERRGHLIAETFCTDSLLTDEGTQTYNFLSAPFQKNMSLADLTTERPTELHLQLQIESVTSRHHKANSAFTFLCGHTFQRREYGKHYKNIHSDIQMGVNGWFEQRCPLAYLGCTYSQKKFQPATHQATINYNEELGCFSLHPTIPSSLNGTSHMMVNSTIAHRRGGGQNERSEDSLSSLPYEVLCHMARFLDSLSLSQLALVSKLMREVCSSLLQERGMVSLHWEKRISSKGSFRWQVKEKVWKFSTLFSPVDTWCFSDVPSMSEHLKVCPYNKIESKTEKICLPRLTQEHQTNATCKGSTLVNLFQQKRIKM